MTRYRSRLLRANDIAEGTVEFVLERPEGFAFLPGQHVSIKLDRLKFEDPLGPRRTFTIASAPHEPELLFVTRNRGSGFKRTLFEGGTDMELLGPLGNMTLDASKPALFIAGGVGISPFRSMVLDVLHRDSDQPMTLLYSERREAAAVFLPLFGETARSHPSRFRFELILTGGDAAKRIDAERIRRAAGDLRPIFYLCGPPGFVESVQNMLRDLAVDARNIKAEIFRGY